MSTGIGARLVVIATAVSSAGAVAADRLPPQVQLTFDIKDNMAYGQSVRDALRTMQGRLKGRLCHPLHAGATLAMRPEFCSAGKAEEPAVVHAVVLRDAAIWRLYSSHPALLEQPMSMGSVSKAIGAVPLLAHSGAHAGEQWCRQYLAGFRNADGNTGYTDCKSAKAHVPAELAMGRSDNLATIWRLRQLAPEIVRKQLRQIGVHNVPDNYHPGIALALGIVEYSPRQALECFDALASGQAIRAAMVDHATAAPTAMAGWCSSAVTTPAGRELADRLLAAPAKAYGTAAFLPDLFKGATAVLAKTGTPADAQDHDTGKLLLTSFLRGGHRYTVLVAVMSPTPALPLAARLASSDLRDLFTVAEQHTRPSAAASLLPRSSNPRSNSSSKTP